MVFAMRARGMPAILRGVSERVDRSWRGAEGKEERREGDGSWYVIEEGQ